MDGLFELMIIALILLAPVFEGWARSRKKRRQEDGADRGGGGDRPRAERTGTTGSTATTGSSSPWGAGQPGAGAGAGGGRGRESGRSGEADRGADELLPDDLWEVLTGQRRGPATEQPPRKPSGKEPEGGEPWEPEAAEPWETAERWEPESTESRPGGADLGGMMSEPSPWDGDVEERGAPPVTEPSEPRTAEVLAELEAELEGARSAAGRGSLGVRRDRISGLRGLRPGRTGKGGLSGMGEGGELHPFFKGLDRDGLRRAVVLNEVLGPPLSQRG